MSRFFVEFPDAPETQVPQQLRAQGVMLVGLARGGPEGMPPHRVLDGGAYIQQPAGFDAIHVDVEVAFDHLLQAGLVPDLQFQALVQRGAGLRDQPGLIRPPVRRDRVLEAAQVGADFLQQEAPFDGRVGVRHGATSRSGAPRVRGKLPGWPEQRPSAQVSVQTLVKLDEMLMRKLPERSTYPPLLT
jgi:hypothetical protein